MLDVFLLQSCGFRMYIYGAEVDASLGFVNAGIAFRALLAPALRGGHSLLSPGAASLRVTKPLFLDALGDGHQFTIRGLCKTPPKLGSAS